MQRRDLLKAMGAGICAGLCHPLQAQPAESKPNIILCMADDQGWGDMAYYDHPELKTPNFDRMAAEGFRFDRFYAAAPVCSPTRGSVMTGRNPNRFGCFSWGRTLRPTGNNNRRGLQNGRAMLPATSANGTLVQS